MSENSGKPVFIKSSQNVIGLFPSQMKIHTCTSDIFLENIVPVLTHSPYFQQQLFYYLKTAVEDVVRSIL